MNLDNLSLEELNDLRATLEADRLHMMRTDIVTFAENIEVPGTPLALTKAQRAALGERIQNRRDVADMKWDERLGGWHYPDGYDDEGEGDLVEYYPRRLESAQHHRLIMQAAEGMLLNRRVSPRMNPRGLVDDDGKPPVPDGAIVTMPPGSAKSSYGSVVVPAYLMGRFPGLDVIGTSYAAELAKRFGRRVRWLCDTPRFREIFRTSLMRSNTAVDLWGLENGSQYRAVGVLGGVTGFRADFLGIDDPIAGREEAESDVIKQKTWEAIKDDLFTRLKPGGKIMLTQTRWAEDDPAGMILGEKWNGESGLWKGTDGRFWLVLSCPLIATQPDDPLGRKIGERLWPEWFTDRFVELARAQGERSWNSLYQQVPAASDGTILMRKYWKCWPHGDPDPRPGQDVTSPSDWTSIVLSYDTAFDADETQSGDMTAMTAWLIFPNKTPVPQRRGEIVEQSHMCLIGAWERQIPAVDIMEAIQADVDHFKPDHIVIEKRASGIQLLQELKRRDIHCMEMGAVKRVNVHSWLPTMGPGRNGKIPRAHAAATNFVEGSIWYIPGRQTLNVIRQCAAFPNGRRDDLVDSVTQAILFVRNNIGELSMSSDHRSIEMDDEIAIQRSQRGAPKAYGYRPGRRSKGEQSPWD